MINNISPTMNETITDDKKLNAVNQNQVGLSLGGNTQNVNLNNNENVNTTEEYTSGKIDNELYNLDTELTYLQEQYETRLRNGEKSTTTNGDPINNDVAEMNKYINNKNDLGKITDKMEEIRNRINELKGMKNYDGRSDEQKREDKLREEQWTRDDKQTEEMRQREDNAYQRAVNDMRVGGLNPSLMFGSGGAAAAGGAINTSSAGAGGQNRLSREKEERRKRRELEIQRERERERIMSQMLIGLTLGAMSGITKLKK